MIYPSIAENIVFTLHCTRRLAPGSLSICLPPAFACSLTHSVPVSHFGCGLSEELKWTCSILLYGICNACVQNAKNWSYPNRRKLTRPTYRYIAYPHYNQYFFLLAWCNLNIVVAVTASDGMMAFGISFVLILLLHSHFVCYFTFYVLCSSAVGFLFECVCNVQSQCICLYSTTILPAVLLPSTLALALALAPPSLLLLLSDQRK